MSRQALSKERLRINFGRARLQNGLGGIAAENHVAQHNAGNN